MIAAPDGAGRTFRDVVASQEALRALIGEPADPVPRERLSSLDDHCRAFIARSPFLLVGTSSAAGLSDVSPRGDAPGFVRVLDDQTLAIPDRVGNRRIDSLLNILENPHAGLLFMIPGVDETLRVNGRAMLVRDEDLLAGMAAQGKRPNLAVAVSVEECFLHCPKAFLRSGLWDTSRFVARTAMPSLARILLDQTRPSDRSAEEHERIVQDEERRLAETPVCLY